ncbi:MAG: hypothetical protein AAGF89_00420, partial [Bacteroidota bacterium]
MKNLNLNIRSFTLLLATIMLLSFYSCSTASTATAAGQASKANELQIDNSERGFDDLTLYLKQIAGVDVKGSGGDAIIQVRGMN